MGKPYTHIPPGEEIRSISGYFSLEKEIRLPFEGQEILYAVGVGVVETSCCGLGGVRYAMVPGAVIFWKNEKGPEGQDVSRVEPIVDPEVQKRLTAFIKKQELVTQVNYL